MLLKEVKSLTLQDAVYEELLQAIISGKLSPGERITLDETARQLNVSIMPVREAFRRLEARKFITLERNRRIVAGLSVNNLDQIVEIRMILECHAAEKASINRSEESIKDLQEACDRYTEAEELEKSMEANREFHGIIYREANLPMLSEIITSMWEKAYPYFYIGLQDQKVWQSFKPRTKKVHQGMLKGMQNKNPEQTKKCLIADISETANLLKKQMEKSQA